jgi:superfamily I DNA/RNA helicase
MLAFRSEIGNNLPTVGVEGHLKPNDSAPFNKERAMLAWSSQQEPIFSFFVDSTDHLVVRARAGTGKTTTIVEAVIRWMAANSGKTAVVCAFNVRIAEELRRKFAPAFGIPLNLPAKEVERLLAAKGVDVKTLHSVGFACCRRYRDRLIIEDARKVAVTRKDLLSQRVCGRTAPDSVIRLVAKLHTLGREVAPHATLPGDLTALAINHDCEPDEALERMGFGLDYVEKKALEAMELAADVKSGDTIDFSDMIFLPVRNGWLVKQWDLGVVDEAQDMTTAQLEIAQGCSDRMVVVGDNCQAIYGFRGADSDSLDRLKTELGATELGLTKTYRCGKSIVELARGWVPDFEAGDDNPEGVVRSIGAGKLTEEAMAGDFILSRLNAPLVPIAMSLLRSGKRARVAGRQIGKDLVVILKKMKANSVPQLLQRIEAWSEREQSRQRVKLTGSMSEGRREAINAKIEGILDQAEMLSSLADGAKNVEEVQNRAESLFSDDGLGIAGVITCSSVHKAKGLEAERVFVLRETLRETTQEERNIAYVAVTRAKLELIWVS